MGMNAQIKELDIMENEVTRKGLMKRVDVLDKVKQLVTLPNSELMTTKMVSEWYEVSQEVIKKVTQRHNEELKSNGMEFKSYKELSELFKGDTLSLFKISRRGSNIFSKRSVLNVGMLLQDSTVAQEVRTNLLDTHEQTSNEQKTIHIDKEKELALAIMFATNEADKMMAFNDYNTYKNRHIEKLENDIKVLEPKAEVHDQISDSTHLITMNKVAKTVGVGQKKLFAFLREIGLLFKEGEYNVPYQQYVNNGYFELKVDPIRTPYGIKRQYTTKVTGKGEIYILNKVNTYGGGKIINGLKLNEISEYVTVNRAELKK